MGEISKYQGRCKAEWNNNELNCADDGSQDIIRLKASEQLVDVVGTFPSLITRCRQLCQRSS